MRPVLMPSLVKVFICAAKHLVRSAHIAFPTKPNFWQKKGPLFASPDANTALSESIYAVKPDRLLQIPFLMPAPPVPNNTPHDARGNEQETRFVPDLQKILPTLPQRHPRAKDERRPRQRT